MKKYFFFIIILIIYYLVVSYYTEKENEEPFKIIVDKYVYDEFVSYIFLPYEPHWEKHHFLLYEYDKKSDYLYEIECTDTSDWKIGDTIFNKYQYDYFGRVIKKQL